MFVKVEEFFHGFLRIKLTAIQIERRQFLFAKTFFLNHYLICVGFDIRLNVVRSTFFEQFSCKLRLINMEQQVINFLLFCKILLVSFNFGVIKCTCRGQKSQEHHLPEHRDALAMIWYVQYKISHGKRGKQPSE